MTRYHPLTNAIYNLIKAEIKYQKEKDHEGWVLSDEVILELSSALRDLDDVIEEAFPRGVK